MNLLSWSYLFDGKAPPGRDLVNYSLQRGQPASREAAATKVMIASTGARLRVGQERTNVSSAIACDTSPFPFSLPRPPSGFCHLMTGPARR